LTVFRLQASEGATAFQAFQPLFDAGSIGVRRRIACAIAFGLMLSDAEPNSMKLALHCLSLIVAAQFANMPPVAGQDKGQQATPSADDIAQLLSQQPLSLQSWPAWRERLLSWIADDSRQTDAAWQAATEFMLQQQDPAGELPAAIAQDAFAWYLLGRGLYRSEDANRGQAAERAYRRSLALDDQFARAHRNLAQALLSQNDEKNAEREQEAEKELALAKQLDPQLKLAGIKAQAMLVRNDFSQAETLFTQALQEEPDSTNAIGVALAVVSNPNRSGDRAAATAPLIAQFPSDGTLACFHAVALAIDGDARSAVREFDRARALGTNPTDVAPPELVQKIEDAARPSPLVLFGWVMLGFAIVYAVVMAAMAGGGVVLASLTRGSGAQQLLSDRPVEIVPLGQVVRSPGEPWLARVYAVALAFGLVLFYVALPFVAVGLLAATLGSLWLIFQANRIPVKLVVLIVVIGGGMIWAVLKSMFARPASGSFGIKKTPADCPKLYGALQEVARRVDTSPVDEVYLAPGAEIGEHQEGRGPFGIFGTKRRVLTLGLSTMRSLTADELKSILAHEYAHFSHKDTFFSRFVRSVDLSIHTALSGMAEAGGWLNYVNPFYWFLYLYYRAYSLLSAGYSRSREFLADRMACSLYGANVFASALTKVGTDGPFFESTMYSSVSHLLGEDKTFINMYEAFGNLQKEEESAQRREELRQALLDEKKSLFASHPTFLERLEAVQNFPQASRADESSAIDLFEDPEALERELTEFLTAVIHLSQQEAEAAAAAA
jgi:Zn-dependent protease with chaperone function